jgi:hypothetical protein
VFWNERTNEWSGAGLGGRSAGGTKAGSCLDKKGAGGSADGLVLSVIRVGGVSLRSATSMATPAKMDGKPAECEKRREAAAATPPTRLGPRKSKHRASARNGQGQDCAVLRGSAAEGVSCGLQGTVSPSFRSLARSVGAHVLLCNGPLNLNLISSPFSVHRKRQRTIDTQKDIDRDHQAPASDIQTCTSWKLRIAVSRGSISNTDDGEFCYTLPWATATSGRWSAASGCSATGPLTCSSRPQLSAQVGTGGLSVSERGQTMPMAAVGCFCSLLPDVTARILLFLAARSIRYQKLIPTTAFRFTFVM